MTLTVDPATSEDLPHILGLLTRSGLPTEGLPDHLKSALVARDNETVVGSIALELYGSVALLRSVAVDRAFRGRGLGSRLTQAALDLARRKGVDEVYLLTETAADFFARVGFRPIARASVTPEVRQSIEFTSACPESALATVRSVTSD